MAELGLHCLHGLAARDGLARHRMPPHLVVAEQPETEFLAATRSTATASRSRRPQPLHAGGSAFHTRRPQGSVEAAGGSFAHPTLPVSTWARQERPQVQAQRRCPGIRRVALCKTALHRLLHDALKSWQRRQRSTWKVSGLDQLVPRLQRKPRTHQSVKQRSHAVGAADPYLSCLQPKVRVPHSAPRDPRPRQPPPALPPLAASP